MSSSEKNSTLKELGWRPTLQQQLSLEEYDECTVARIVEQHKNRLVIITEDGQLELPSVTTSDPLCVGDWLLVDKVSQQFVRRLERISLFQRKSPGTKVQTQLIAANVDHLMIVSSLNLDFNLSRLERYLALAREAGVEPIIVLTKSDLCEGAQDYVDQVQALDAFLNVITLNALEHEDVQRLTAFCGVGQTIAFVGSSGVGKSTLVNTLLNDKTMETAGIREDDSKGRHTTTHRALKRLPNGGLLMDTPGIRELQLVECDAGINETFSEIVELTKSCRFSDCGHISEPGCSIQAALRNGDLDTRRFANYEKLLKEQAFNSATLAQKRDKDKAFGKMIHSVQSASRKMKKGY